jgi:hypothetical protein
MTKDEVLAVLDEMILSHKSSWGGMSDYPLVRATQDEALAAVAALYEERAEAERRALTFARMLGAILHNAGGSVEVSSRDVLEVSLPLPGVRYSIEFEDKTLEKTCVIRLVEHALPPIPENHDEAPSH